MVAAADMNPLDSAALPIDVLADSAVETPPIEVRGGAGESNCEGEE